MALDAGHIAIFGPQSVGKTTFVTVLLHELDHRVGPERGFILEPLTDEIRERYEREYHDLTYGGDQFGVGEDLAGDAYRRSHSATPEPGDQPGRPAAPRLSPDPPQGGRGAPARLLSFFDTAGEDWEMNIDLLRGEARYLRLARGLLFLIDPLRIREVAHDRRLTLTEKERHVPAADYLNDARKLATFFPKTPVKTPAGHLPEQARPLGPPDGGGDRPERGRPIGPPGRARPRASTPRVHEEVQAALHRWGATGFLEHVAVNFPNHRFFACSSLGDAAQEREDAPQPLPTPLLIDRPGPLAAGTAGDL